MSMDTSRADMTQAVLEGVAFALRDSLRLQRVLELNKLSVPRSVAVVQKEPAVEADVANVMNIKVDVLEVEEGPSLGGAALAGRMRCYPDVADCWQEACKSSGYCRSLLQNWLRNKRRDTRSSKNCIHYFASFCQQSQRPDKHRILLLPA